MVDGFTIITVLIAGVALALGFFLMFSQGRDTQRLLFALLNIVASVWILTSYFGNVAVNTLTHSFILADYTTGVILGLLFWLFCRVVKLQASGQALRMDFAAVAAFTAAIVVELMIFAGMIFHIDVDTANDVKMTTAEPLYPLYPLVILALVGHGIFYLVRALIKSRDYIQKMRLKLVVSGLTIAFVCIAVPNFILENILPYNDDILLLSYNSAYAGILVFLAVSTYAIVKHGLFDIKLAAVRSAAYILAILTLSGIYYLIAYLVSLVLFNGVVSSSVSLSPVNILLALILAFIFQPIKHFFDKITDNIFYRDSYRSEDFYVSLSDLLTSTVDLRGLLERASSQIAATLKADQTYFLLYYTNSTEHHVSAGTRGHTRLPMYDARMLQDHVARTPQKVIITDLMDEANDVRRMLASHKIAIAMPLMQGEKNIGFLLLGSRLSGSYTKRDLGALMGISNQLVIAIQNALSLHEVKELNATLQQRIDVATKELRSSNAQLKHLDEVKDEFMSMASHQLRTPLTSVKGYISMVLEGDAGRILPQQQKLLLEAFKSSERMVGLIADFLNVSRLQTGRFVIEKTLFDLKDVVKQEVSDLDVIANSHDIKLRLKTDEAGFLVRADESKVRQVIMNFVDNAIYYSHPNSTIVINLERVKDHAVLTVVDTGIGVPEEEQSRLFNKFFRAKNARKQRPDGTGVGLYLARKVITSHDGSLIFSSKEGKGSTFGFRLPLQPESTPATSPGRDKKLAATTK